MQISTSKVKCFKACKRLYYLKYEQGLEYTQKIEALEDGKTYHSKIEQLYKQGWFTIDEENPKVSAMALAYEKFIYPYFKVKKAECSFEAKITDKHLLVGRIDAVTEDGFAVEHKTTSKDVDDKYVYNLSWDEQILNYMLAVGVNKMYYTVCKKPTIRQKVNETTEEYLERCIQWYEEDTDKKIRVLEVERNKDEIKTQLKELVLIADEMEQLKGKDELHFYCNPSNCEAYGRRCEFSSICKQYDPNIEYVEFKKKEVKPKVEDVEHLEVEW